MARKHFNTKGFPDSEIIATEIINFFSNLPTEYERIATEIKTNFKYNMLDPTEEGYLSMLLNSYKSIPKSKIDVYGIYIVGSQAEYLPEKYLPGNHDLDLKLVTNINDVIEDSNLINLSTEVLKYYLNERSNIKSKHPKECFLDILSEEKNDRLYEPYVKIYSQ